MLASEACVPTQQCQRVGPSENSGVKDCTLPLIQEANAEEMTGVIAPVSHLSCHLRPKLALLSSLIRFPKTMC